MGAQNRRPTHTEVIIITQYIMAKFIVNELLMYAISIYDTDNIVDIKNVINTFYCEEAVNDAKTELWTYFADKLDRIVNHRSKVKTIDDIIDAVHLISAVYPEKEKLPIVFVALNNKNLPFICEKTSPSRDNSVDNRLAALEMQMKVMLTNPVTTCRNVALHQTYSSSLKTGIKNNSEQHVPHQLLQPSPPTEVHHDNTIHSVGITGWEVKTSRSRRSKAVYGTKQSEGLLSPPRGFMSSRDLASG